MYQRVYNVLGFLVIMLVSTFAYSQSSGTIKGKVIDRETKETLPGAQVVVLKDGRQYGGSVTDAAGNYTIGQIPPGKYDVEARFVGYTPVLKTDVYVKPDRIEFVNFELSAGVVLDAVEIIEHKVPIMEKDNTQQGATYTSEELSKMAGRGFSTAVVTTAGVFSADGESIGSIRGQRSEGNVYYVDGVRVRGSASLPKSALEMVTVITGGLPAQYGDATGGVIQVTTKGASRKFAAGLELVTSQFLDPYGYNLAGFSVQGPLIKGRDTTNPVALLGFFLAGEVEYTLDSRPFHPSIGVWKAKDDVLEYLEQNPLRPSGLGWGAYQNGSYLRLSDFEKIKRKINDEDLSINLSGKLDVRTGINTILTFGGSMNYNNDRVYIHDYSLFNYKNNPQVIDNTWRVFGRFAQRFPTNDTIKIIRNISYEIQADYSKYTQTVQDYRHKNKLFNYGYIGKFTTTKVRSYELTDLPSLGLYDIYLHNGFRDLLYWFEPNYDINPILATYTNNYYQMYDKESGFYANSVIVQNGGALLNGQLPPYIYGLWASPGTVYNNYSKADLTQIGINTKASVDIKSHSLQFGFQYDQRIDRYYAVAPVGLWYRMRQLANKHIEQLDTTNPILVYDQWGVFQDTVWFNRLYDGPSQAFIDYNIRKHLGLPVDGLDWLDIDSYDPSMFKIEWFSADELLNEGISPYVTYFGYDHTGKKLKHRPGFDDFFTKRDEFGNYLREVPAFEPIYMATYIQDKFSIEDLIFNIGVRVDRFDANQKVLKDPYLLYEAKTVKEVTEFGEHPANMGPDYVVYVDDIKNPSMIMGYRNGSTWYNSQGIEVTDPTLLRGPGGIAPYLVDPSLTRPTSSAFKDYEPQITVMPRVAFSFPISDDAVFFAHYDVLSKRPTTGLRLDITDYYFIAAQGQNVLNNPALKPEITIDYELGFMQKLNLRSGIKLSAYYREIRNLVQVYRFTEAYPVSYISYSNIDFGTVKGFSISYDLRRSANTTIKASYTLQFADGTGSSATSAVTLVRTGQPNLRIINPLDFDRRHSFSLILDYRYGSGKDYNGPVIRRAAKEEGKVKEYRILENTGANLVFVGGSGVPYSRSSTIVPTQLGGGTYVLQGSINGSRLPWQFTTNVRIDRDIFIKLKEEQTDRGTQKKELVLNVYLDIINALNAKNIISVYRATGNADDDGYLSAAEYQAGINAQLDPIAFREQYALKVNSPYNYTLPRRMRFGVILSF